MNHRNTFLAVAAGAVMSLAADVSAANWSDWRGPNHNGTSPETGLPVKFSRTENVKWKTDLPGISAATPIIHGNHVFLSSADESNDTLHALALDRRSGKILWNHEIASTYRRDSRSTFAAPSPVTDGRLVYFFYGNGELAAYSFDGKKAWRRNLQDVHGQFSIQWTPSSTPLLYAGKLYIQVLQRDVQVEFRGARFGKPKDNKSYLLAVDPKTGKDLWKVYRSSAAVMESREAFSSPYPFIHKGREEIVLVGGDAITGHHPATGKELWRWGTWNPDRISHWRLVPSPVSGAGVVLACGPKGAPIFAVKAGGSGRLGDDGVAWSSPDRDITSDVPTPAFYEGKFYVVNDKKGLLLCVNPGKGNVVWKGKLKGLGRITTKFEASPTVADGHIYLMNHKGEVIVAKAGGKELLQVHVTAMGKKGAKNLRSAVAVSQGNLFIRTGSELFCIGK
jgi:outer membrane protein assembly factor BamB